jgi:pimeloyl-ACP methyl ester carboxylesterase
MVSLDSGMVTTDAGVKTDADSTTPVPEAGAGVDSGSCCPTGDCLCHGTPPARLSAAKGPYKTASLRLSTGTAYYPTDAPPPFAGIAICPGFTNTGPEMADWGPFYASWGIVIVVTNTGGLDDPPTRGDLLLGSIKALKAENTKSGSPLNGKMSGRYGTSGYSMGGGGTTYASSEDPTLKSSVGLAAWEPIGRNIKVPTLLMCGSADLVAECSHTDGSYNAIPNTTPKMKIVISGAEHLASWFGPDQAGNGTSGGYALAFNKVYLEGDTRWKTLLLTKPQGHEMTTNITP